MTGPQDTIVVRPDEPQGFERLWPRDPGVFTTLLVSAIGFLLIGAIGWLEIPSDIGQHARFVAISSEHRVWLAEFSFFLIISVASGFTQDLDVISNVILAVLTLSIAAKFWISRHIAYRSLGLTPGGAEIPRQREVSRLLLLALFLGMFVFSLPIDHWEGFLYIGQFPANVWHNSTTIFLMPLALLLYWQSWRTLEDPSTRNLLFTLLLSIANLTAKPSFIICVGIAFPLAALFRYGFRAPFWKVVAVMVVTLAFLLAQFWYTFHADFDHIFYNGRDVEGGVKIAPFNIWGYYSGSYIASFVASFLYPLAALAARPRELLASSLYRYTLGLNVVGFVAFLLLSETGLREFDANFTWQVIIAIYMLFLATTIEMFRAWIREPALRRRDLVVAAAFLAHVAAGVAYAVRMLVLGDFL